MERTCFRRIASRILISDDLDITPDKIKYKFIESILYDYINQPLTAHEIMKKCNALNYENITENDIDNILSINNNYINYHSNEDMKYSMRVEYFTLIKEEYREKNIEAFIEQYYSENVDFFIDKSLSEIKNVIYDFFYKVSNNNLLEFRKIATKELQVGKEIEIASTYNDFEIKYINKFLNWNNDKKNELIFKLSNIGLEYSILSNANDYDLFSKIGATNKKFLLDTNIIFRLLGLNGIHRQKRIETFLFNCIKTKQALHISKYTEIEFRKSITFHCEQLKKYSVSNTKLFNEFSFGEDFYNYFYNWRTKNQLGSIDVFKSYVMQLYEKLKDKYNIILIQDSLDEYDYDIERKIDNCANRIHRYKANNYEETDYNLWIPKKQYYDAKNILLIDKLRNGNNLDFLSAEYFFISTDHKLLNWDHERNEILPIIILPSHWLAISIRFLSGSTDDYKSFINFINLPNRANTITNKELTVILSAIQDIEESGESQEYILKGILSVKISNILKSRNPDKIFKRAKETAIQVRQDLLSAEKKKSEELENQIAGINNEKEKIEDESKNLKNKINMLSNNLNLYIQDEKNRYFNKQKLIWSLKGIGFLFLSIIIILFYFFELFFHDYDWNIAYKLIIYIEGVEEETVKIFLQSINWLIFAGGAFFHKNTFNYLISRTKKKQFLKKINDDWQHKIKDYS